MKKYFKPFILLIISLIIVLASAEFLELQRIMFIIANHQGSEILYNLSLLIHCLGFLLIGLFLGIYIKFEQPKKNGHLSFNLIKFFQISFPFLIFICLFYFLHILTILTITSSIISNAIDFLTIILGFTFIQCFEKK